MDTQPILIELPVIPVEPEPSRDPAAIAFSRRLAMLRGEVEPPDSDIPVCVYCGKSSGRLIESDAVGDFIHEECWPAFHEHPEVKAIQAQAAAETEAKEEEYSRWVREGQTLGSRRKGLIVGFNDLQFQVGDWLVKGEDRGFVSSGRYQQAAKLTGYAVSSLQKFASVSRRVPACIRVCKPWAVHQAVAPVENEADRAAILKKAVEKNWSVRDLKNALKPNLTRQETMAACSDEAIARASQQALISKLNTWAQGIILPDNLGMQLWRDRVKLAPESRELLIKRLRESAAYLIEKADELAKVGA
jgi:hypothetical protein